MNEQGNDRYQALIRFLDDFTAAGGIDIALAKKTILRDGQEETSYIFDSSEGYRFQSIIYYCTENNESVRFFGLWLQLCPLNTLTQPYVALSNLLQANTDVPSPTKFGILNGNVAVSLRLKVDSVNPEYVQELVYQALEYAKQALGVLLEKHGATAIANIPAQNRMVQ